MTCLGLAVDLGGAALVRQPDPDIAVGIELDVERPLRLLLVQRRQRVISNLAGHRVEFANELIAEVGVPGVAVGIDDHVMRQGFFPRQVIFGDDDVGRPALRARQPLERQTLIVGIVDVGRDEELGGRVHHVGRNARTFAASAALQKKLRTGRHGLGRVATHAHEHVLPFFRSVQRREHALQRVAADAIRQE